MLEKGQIFDKNFQIESAVRYDAEYISYETYRKDLDRTYYIDVMREEYRGNSIVEKLFRLKTANSRRLDGRTYIHYAISSNHIPYRVSNEMPAFFDIRGTKRAEKVERVLLRKDNSEGFVYAFVSDISDVGLRCFFSTKGKIPIEGAELEFYSEGNLATCLLHAEVIWVAHGVSSLVSIGAKIRK